MASVRLRRLSFWAAVILALAAAPARADSPACNQAQAIVDEAKSAWASGQPAHASLLARLSTARDLCPALGEAWKYSYCSAQAIGDANKARIYRDRALFNGITQLECSPGSVTVAPLPTVVRNKYALLVGVGDFADPDIPKLHFAAKDARDLRAVLVDPRYGNFPADNVRLLTDQDATRVNILKELNRLSLEAQEDDLVLLFFSSHGSPHKEGTGLQGIGYILTHDSSRQEVFLNALEFDDLASKVSTIRARRKVTLLDTCYSGQSAARGGKAMVLEGFGVGVDMAKLFLSGEGSYIITSSSANEVSFESDQLKNGYFTYYLIEALRQGAEPPTLAEVFSRLSSQVRASVARDKGAPQNPHMLPEDGKGDLRIGVVPQQLQR
ncbi:MAG TPA: caspase family protein [Thermoanaerobaculia bacterium]|jgi:hypothetical protein|nr:caspase family protein [Thermoanaerobaculia bacterium]